MFGHTFEGQENGTFFKKPKFGSIGPRFLRNGPEISDFPGGRGWLLGQGNWTATSPNGKVANCPSSRKRPELEMGLDGHFPSRHFGAPRNPLPEQPHKTISGTQPYQKNLYKGDPEGFKGLPKQNISNREENMKTTTNAPGREAPRGGHRVLRHFQPFFRVRLPYIGGGANAICL